jgi:tetratricopeptide (TPR) repeat protein
MQTLRLELTPIDATWVRLRYWLPDLPPETRQLPLAEIQPLIDRGELYYYTSRPDLLRVGQQLFAWIDGDGRWLSRAIQSCSPPGLVLAIDAEARLAHLPWEVLHDGHSFLVERLGTPVIPVRLLASVPAAARSPAPRSLQVLFMAAAPERVQPALEFEQEEAEILRCTAELPLTLRVEESGCIEEMGNLWRKHPGDTFDVFHLTGHATIQQGEPVFLTETVTGDLHPAPGPEIFSVFSGRVPRLVFLSGCRTAQASEEGTVASMAATLVQQGIPAVLGWGLPVLDRTGTAAAAQLYQRLAEGFSITEALSATYRYLLQQQVSDWHLLRLHARDQGWGALVDPPGDYVPPFETVQDAFLDPADKVRVAGPDQFVGRRRLLQRSLRYLRQGGCIGLLLHGLGGTGKSSVAARLLERLPDYTRVVIYRHLDATELISRLAQQCVSELGHQILNSDLPPMQKLSRFLREGLNRPEQRFCLVLDDFEANLEADVTGKQVLQPAVVPVLNDLFTAMIQSGKPHRVILTSRYDVAFPQHDRHLERESVPALKGADLTKKYNRLVSFRPQATVDAELQAQAKTVADGNPRLLEWLDRILPDAATNQEPILERMAAAETRFREDILAAEPLKQQSETLQAMLSRALVFDLAVPAAVLSALWQEVADPEPQRQRAEALGLLEVSQPGGVRSYRVPKILTPLLPDLPTPEADPALYETAATALYESWWVPADVSVSEEQVLELYRLAKLAGQDETAIALGVALGVGWKDQGRYREAIPVHAETLELRRRVLGEEHPDVAASLNNLAALYDDQGRYGEAEPLYVQALGILFQQLGQDHPNTQTGLGNFFECLNRALQSGQADRLSDHPTTQAILQHLRSQSAPE